MHVTGDTTLRRHPSPPRPPAATIPRPRLTALTSQPWDALVVHGPAGSGKSVLMADWVARHPSLEARWIEVCAPTAHLPEDILDIDDDALVVIDRAERLTPSAVDALGRALARSRAARLVLLTRSEATASAVIAATDQTVLIIGPEDLRTDDEELAALLPALRESALPEAAKTTGRLIAAVEDVREGKRSRAHERFRATLFADLADRPAGYRESLARLAVVQSVDATVAVRLGIDPAHLPTAAADGLGAITDGWFDLTPFAARVIEPLRIQLDAAAEQRLVDAALDSPELRDHRPLQAVRLALRARRFRAASDVIVHTGLAIVDEPEAVRRAFEGVGYADIKHYPMLVIVLAQVANLHWSTRLYGLTLFGRAIAAIRSGAMKARPHEAIGFRAFAATLLRFTPAADQALAQSLRAVAELDGLDEIEVEGLEVVGAQVLTHVGLTAMASGDDDSAATMYERAYGVCLGLGSAEMVDPLSLRAALAAMRGELPLARDLAETADSASWPPGWRRGLRGQALELALAVLALESGDLAATRTHLTATGPIADLLEHWASFAVVQAWCDLVAGEPMHGIERLRAVRSHRSRTPTTSVTRSRLAAAESMLLLAAGDAAGARSAAAAVAKHSAAGALHLAWAQAGLGRAGEAGATLAGLARARLSPRDTLGADVLRATIALSAGDEEPADALTVRIAGQVQTTGMRLPFALLTDDSRARLVASAERVGEAALAATVTAAQPVAPPVQIRPPRLTERERAVLALLTETISTAQLATQLYVSVNTVKTQLRSLYRKLGANTRAQAIARAVALGLLSSPETPRAQWDEEATS